MSFPPTANFELVELQARLATMDARAAAQKQELTARDTDLKRTQAALLLAQAQILELGDLLAARETALKNAEAGAPDLQRLLDTELARANDLRRQLREAQDALAAGQLAQAAAHERAAAAEQAARDQINAGHRETDGLRQKLAATETDLAGHRQHVANLEALLAQLRSQVGFLEKSERESAAQHTAVAAERDALRARLARIEQHWLWRSTGALHD